MPGYNETFLKMIIPGKKKKPHLRRISGSEKRKSIL